MAAWTNEVQPFGSNRAPLLSALSENNDGTVVPLAADPATGRLLVSSSGGGGGGTSSTFGAAFPTTGTAVGASDGTNMQPLLVDGSGYLEVNVKAGGGGGTQYTDGGTPPTHPIGGTIEWNNAGTWATVGSAEPLPISGTIAATQSGNWTFVPTTLNNTGTITTSASSIISGVIQNFESGFIPTSIHGTYAGVSFGITVSDDGGSTYYNVPIYDQNAMRWLAPGATITPGTNASNVYWVPNIPNGAGTYLKVLASAYSTGTANVRTGGSSSGVVNMPGSQMAQITDGAGNARSANVDANGNLNTHDYATSATGSAVPADAIYLGMDGASGNLAGLNSGANTMTAGNTNQALTVTPGMYNGSTTDGQRNAATASGTSGAGVAAAGEMTLAATALPTAVSNAQNVQAMSDKFGRQVILSQAPRDLVGFQATTFTASTASATVVTGVANIFADISSVTLTNSGASATTFLLSDGTNVYTLYVPAGDMRGAVYQVPLAATTVATNWTGQCGTSTSSVICTITFIKNR